MNNLKIFYDNEIQREAVLSYLKTFLKEIAIERVMERKNTDSIADANEIIDKAFIRLKEVYGEVPRPNIQSSR